METIKFPGLVEGIDYAFTQLDGGGFAIQYLSIAGRNYFSEQWRVFFENLERKSVDAALEGIDYTKREIEFCGGKALCYTPLTEKGKEYITNKGDAVRKELDQLFNDAIDSDGQQET